MKHKLLDIIDFKKIDVLLEGYYKSTGFVTAILDLEGKVLSKSEWQSICTEFHRVNPKTAQKCLVSDTELANKMASGEKYHFYKCLNGLVDVAIPIVIKGEHIANLFAGQFFFEKPNVEFFEKQAQKYGFNEKSYIDTLDKIPVFTEEQVKIAMDFLLKMTDLIVEMAIQRVEQIELNKTVKESEDNFRAMYNNSLDMYVSVSPHDASILRCNETLLNNLGYTREEVIGAPIFKMYHDECMDEVKKVFHQFVETGRIKNKELILKRKDGSKIEVSLNVNAIRDEAGKILYSISSWRDISERKETEETIKETKANLESLIDNRKDSIWSLDRDYNYLVFNKTYAQIIFNAYGVELKRGINALEIQPVEIHEFWKSKFEPVFKGENVVFEFAHKLNGNDHYFQVFLNPIFTDGIVTGASAVSMDISDRKNAEDALKESENRFSELLENVNLIAVQLNMEGEVTYCNPFLIKLSGYTKKELLGKNWFDKMVPVSHKETTNKFSRGLKAGKIAEHLENPIKTKGGKIRDILWNNTVLRDTSGGIIGTASIGEDITDRKLAEEEILQYSKQIKQLLSTTLDGYILSDTEGSILEVNPAYCQIVGYTPEELLSMNINNLEVQLSPEEIKQRIDDMVRDGKAKFNSKHKAKNGDIHELDVSIVALHTSNKPVVAAFLRDITKQKITEKELNQSNNRYRSLFDDSPVPLWEENFGELLDYLDEIKKKGIIDFRAYFDKNPQELIKCSEKVKIIDVNQATLNLHQAKDKIELLGNLQKIFTQNSILTFKEEIIAILNGDSEFESESEVKTLSGEIRSINLKLKIDQSIPNLKRAILATVDITDRKRSEAIVKKAEEQVKQTLVDSEKRYRNLFENINVGFVLFEVVQDKKGNPEDLIIVAANKFFEKTTGLFNKKVEGKLLSKVLPGIEKDAANWIGTYGKIALTGKSHQFEQGSELLGYYYTISAFQSEPKRCAVTFLDITERKQAEDSILQKSKDLAALLEISQTLTTTLSMETVLQNIIDRATKLIGLDTGAIYLVNGENLFLGAAYPPIPPQFPDKFRHALLEEHPHIKKSISTGLPVILPDVETADLSPAEKEIKESRKMRSLLYIPLLIENRANGILILGTQNETHDFLEAEINLYRTMSGQAAMAVYNSQLFEEIKELNVKLEQRVNDRTAELSESQEALLNIVEDLNEKTSQLEKSSKLLELKNKELETFTYSVSHDLKAPLRGIDGYSRLLEEEYASVLKGDGSKFIKTIREGTKQMTELIEDLLSYSRLERSIIRNSKFNLAVLIDSILLLLKSDIKNKNISVVVNTEDYEIISDSDGLNIAIRNLIENAIKFSDQVDNPKIEISVKENVYSWVISVSDNGIGFDMKFHDRIFEIFQRLNLPEQYVGTGIGLAMVSKTMERLNGKVWAESSPGKGAKFYLEIPKK